MLARIKVGTRPSPLAFRQVEEIQARLPGVRMEIMPIQTLGDKDKKSPLWGQEKSNFFTYEIEQALLNRQIDAAVHSAKDLEEVMPEQLTIAAITASISPFECLVSRHDLSLDKLPIGARVATSSRKRQEAILRFRPDLTVGNIRGNIDERLKQLDSGDFDALIIAHAALLRLELEHRITQVIPEEIMPPHPLQGRIAVQIRRERNDLFEMFRSLNDA